MPAASPVTEDVSPAPAVFCEAPARMIEHVEPALVIEYVAPTRPVTISTPNQQYLPACTMAAVTTGVNLDTTSLERTVAEQERVTAEQIVRVPVPRILECFQQSIEEHIGALVP